MGCAVRRREWTSGENGEEGHTRVLSRCRALLCSAALSAARAWSAAGNSGADTRQGSGMHQRSEQRSGTGDAHDDAALLPSALLPPCDTDTRLEEESRAEEQSSRAKEQRSRGDSAILQGYRSPPALHSPKPASTEEQRSRRQPLSSAALLTAPLSSAHTNMTQPQHSTARRRERRGGRVTPTD